LGDVKICKDYKLSPKGYNYAYLFMPKMKEMIDGMIDDYMKRRGIIDRTEAIGRIYEEFTRITRGKRFLAKHIDDYNMYVAHDRRRLAGASGKAEVGE